MAQFEKIRWGILGTGRIAGVFATGLTALEDAELVAVGSRSQQSADAFADKFDIPRRHASYEALAADPEIDAIYIATPHNLHAENSILCMQQGKAVLCEKPFTVNARETEKVIAVARQEKRFLMEAMWSRFLPALIYARDLVLDGAIGELRMIQADFGYRAGFDPEKRTFNPALAGGGLLDVGIYPISLAHWLLGEPAKIAGLAEVGTTGVDEQAAWVFLYPGGEMAVMSSAVRTTTQHEAILYGTEGWIRLPAQFWNAKKLILHRNGKEDETFEPPRVGNGYNYEAAEVANCLRAGKLESDVLPLAETLAMMRTMDELRRQWGVKYPME